MLGYILYWVRRSRGEVTDCLVEDGKHWLCGKRRVVPFDVGLFERKVLLRGGQSVTQQSRWKLIRHGWKE